MGIVRMGPPEELVLLLKRDLNVPTFVETGTFKGGTAAWASNHFKRVITIENSKMYFDEARNSYKHLQNVEFLLGDSRAVLKNVVTQVREPAIFWLDAHWCSMDSYGSNDQCPIIDEINLIRSTGIKHYLFIDDARLFLSPPPLPNKTEQWPTIDQICSNIQFSCLKSEAYYIVVFEDVIIAAPDARSLLAEYCQAANTKAWIEYGTRIAPKGVDLIKQGVRVIAQEAWGKLKQAIRPKGVTT